MTTPDRTFSDEQAESLLAGRGSDTDDLASFLRTAKATAQLAPDEATQALHLAAIAEAASQVTVAERAPRSRSRDMLATLFRPLWAKIAATTAVLVFATGGLAAADVLPDPAQDAVASVASNVGIDLPRSDDDDDQGVNSDDDKRKADSVEKGNVVDPDDEGKHKGQDKVKTGLDHDGDGVPDDNGNHTGQTDVKTGLDHDGDGVPDDNGNHTGQNKQSDDGEVDDVDQGQVEDDDDDQGEPEDDGAQTGPKKIKSGENDD